MLLCYHPRMTQAEIKAWLKAIGKNRAWLAGALGVELSTVNQLLYSKRAIPARTEKLIALLMGQYPAASGAAVELPAPAAAENVLVLSVPPSDFSAWNKAALSAGQLVADWAVAVLNEAAASIE